MVWQSILIFNKHLEHLSGLMLLKCFEMNTELTQRDRDGDSWRETKTNRDNMQTLRRTAIMVHKTVFYRGYWGHWSCLIGRDQRKRFCERNQRYTLFMH